MKAYMKLSALFIAIITSTVMITYTLYAVSHDDKASIEISLPALKTFDLLIQAVRGKNAGKIKEYAKEFNNYDEFELARIPREQFPKLVLSEEEQERLMMALLVEKMGNTFTEEDMEEYRDKGIFSKFFLAITPPSRTVFSYSEDPIDFMVGSIKYRIPKAYLSRKSHIEGKASTPIWVWASSKDNMMPWTLSESFKKKDKTALIRIHLYGQWQSYENFKNNITKTIDRVLASQKRSFPDRIDEVDQGIYKEKFHRYNTLGSITKTQDGRGSNDYFIPIIETNKPYLIKCNRPYLNPKWACEVQTISKTKIQYNFYIPFHSIEKFLEVDKTVETLVDQFVVKEN